MHTPPEYGSEKILNYWSSKLGTLFMSFTLSMKPIILFSSFPKGDAVHRLATLQLFCKVIYTPNGDNSEKKLYIGSSLIVY